MLFLASSLFLACGCCWHSCYCWRPFSCIAGHQHWGWWTGIGIPASGISFRCRSSQYWTGSYIPIPDWFQHLYFFSFRCRTDRMPDSPAFIKHFTLWKWIGSACKSVLLAVESDTSCKSMEMDILYPRHQYCWRWKGIHLACLLPILLAVEMNTPRAQLQYVQGADDKLGQTLRTYLKQ